MSIRRYYVRTLARLALTAGGERLRRPKKQSPRPAKKTS